MDTDGTGSEQDFCFLLLFLNDVHAFEAEMLGSRQQPRIIRVDAFQAVFGGARQMDGIGGTQPNRGREDCAFSRRATTEGEKGSQS